MPRFEPRLSVRTAVIVFIALGAVVDFCFTRWIIDANTAGDAGRLYHLVNEQGAQLPIFGASKALYDYDPAQMGIDAFNYGLDGASYDVTDALLEIELSKRKTTPIVVDLKPQADHGIGDPAAFIPLVFDARIRNMLTRTGSMGWRYPIPGIRYFGYYDYYLKQFINGRAQLVRTVERGFSNEKYWSFDRARLERAVQQRLLYRNGYFPDHAQDARLLARIRQHPERLFFLVYSPVHASCYAHFEDLDAFKAYKASMATLPNVVILDYEQPDYPDEWFKDTTHLLNVGAQAFSRTVGARIRAEIAARARPHD